MMTQDLIERFGGKWVAFKGKDTVIVSANTASELIEKIPKKDWNKVTFSKIAEKNSVNIL